MSRRPVFVALPPPDRFWRQYRIYEDRVELDTVLGVLTIPFDDIDSVAPCGETFPGSGAGLVIDRKEGWIRRVRIRPLDRDDFHTALEGALSRHKDSTRDC